MLQAFNNSDNSFNTTTTDNYPTSDDRSEILAWLSPLESQVQYPDTGARRVDSIGAWLPETEEFRRWKHGSREDGPHHPILFREGDPGARKSYLT